MTDPSAPRFTTLPLVPGPWKTLTPAESRALLRRLDTHLFALHGPEHRTRRFPMRDLRAVPLTFYPGWLLVEGEADLAGGQVGTFDALYGPGFLAALNGSSTLIHELNAGVLTVRDDGAVPEGGQSAFVPSPLAPLRADTTGPGYLHFFCNAVRGDEGAFRIVQNERDLRLCGALVPTRPLRKHLRRVTMREDGEDLLAEAVVLYGGMLFDAAFRVSPAGSVRMERDEPLASDVAPAEKTREIFRHVRSAARGER
jgi:hypothetical protein